MTIDLAIKATAAALFALSLAASALAQDAEPAADTETAQEAEPAQETEQQAEPAQDVAEPELADPADDEATDPEAEPAAEEEAGAGAHAEEGATVHYPIEYPHQLDWSFSGPFGRYDPEQLQRGFNVYITVCDSCHGLGMVAYRNLADEGGLRYTEEEARAYASAQTVADPTNPQGERLGALSDYFPNPFASEADARAVNNGALPPDLSLIAKARAVTRGFPTFLFDIVTQYQEGGPNYVYSLLTGYQDPPAGVEVAPGQYYNPYFIAGPALAMPPPLVDGAVPYPANADEDPANDVPETVDQYARDVSAFLMWAAEPHLVARKSMGLTVIVFLTIFAGLVYYTKKKVWAPLHREEGVA